MALAFRASCSAISALPSALLSRHRRRLVVALAFSARRHQFGETQIILFLIGIGFGPTRRCAGRPQNTVPGYDLGAGLAIIIRPR